jgi:aminoglycoside phosphotransferase (APT) family kinase protein
MIDERLVHRLVATQFPQWADLLIRPVLVSGWDNRTFHLGEHMLVRLPSAEDYALQVEKEQRFLPYLAPLLPLAIPVPLGLGVPAKDYPWPWSVYAWLPGETVASGQIQSLNDFAVSLANFLLAFQGIDAAGGPKPGLHSFGRGGSLSIYDAETKQAIEKLIGKINVTAATEVWELALGRALRSGSMVI